MIKETSKSTSITLRVGAATNPGALKTSICAHLRDGKEKVDILCVGVAANYIVTKSIIMARGHLAMVGKKIKYEPYYEEVIIDAKNRHEEERKKTAIRWEISYL